MTARSPLVSGIVSIIFVFGPVARCEPPAAQDAKAIEAAQPRRTDLHGDPLPPGAIARLGTVRLRSGADCIAFSPDGKVLVSGDNAGLLAWDAATGAPLGGFTDKGPAMAARYAADGKTLLTADRSGVIRHWDAATGVLLRETKQARRGHLRCLAAFFSANGKVLGTLGISGEVQLWDTATGEQTLQSKHKVPSTSNQAALSPDGKVLAAGGKNNRVHLIDTTTDKEMRQIDGLFRCFTFSPDGRSLAGVLDLNATESSVCLWDVETGKLRHQVAVERLGLPRLAFSPDGKYLAACGHEGPIRLYDMAGGKEVRRFERRPVSIGNSSWGQHALVFSPDGRTLASADASIIRLWDVATGERRPKFPGHASPVNCLAFSADGGSLASGEFQGGTLMVWDLATHKPRYTFDGHFPGALSLAYSPDGKLLASGDGYVGGTGGLEAKIRLWDLSQGRLMRAFFAHVNSVESLSFSPDGKTLASAGHDARAKLWDVATGRRLHQIRGVDSQVKSVAFSPDGKLLIVAGTSGELALWNPASGQKVRDLCETGDESRTIFQAAFLPDGKTIFSRVLRRGDVRVDREDRHGAYFWDSGSGRLLRSFPMGNGYAWGMRSALSPDGKTLAVSSGDSNDPAIRLWDTGTGKPMIPLRGHGRGAATALTFSSDGRVLASGGTDTTVLLWDISHARLEYLWEQLAVAGGDGARAAKALKAKPEESVPFLKERLRRAAEAEDRASRWIADLDSDQFPVREKASRELEKLGPDAAFAMRDALQGELSAEVRRRIQAILDGMKRPGGETPGSDPRSVWLSLAVLEEIGTPVSRQVLEALAKGSETSRVAREARSALERLAKRRNNR